LATIGRREAVVDLGWLRLTGRTAWFVWSLAHIYFLIGFRNRMAVALDWLWSYLTYQRGARLITGRES
jgi:NADH dehydrogenase